MFKTSACLILLCYISSVLGVTDEMQEVLDVLHNTCRDQTGVDEGLIKNAQNGIFAEDENLKCYAKCLMTEMATMDDDGIIDIEAAVALFPDNVRPIMEPTIRKCGTQIGSDPCDNALKTFQCYYENNKAEFLLP